MPVKLIAAGDASGSGGGQSANRREMGKLCRRRLNGLLPPTRDGIRWKVRFQVRDDSEGCRSDDFVK